MEEPNPMNEKSKKQPRERKILIGVLSVLVVVIVGLVVAIVVGMNSFELTDNVQVIARCNEINDRYNENLDYNQAIASFDDSLNDSANIQKMYLSICYAKFIYKNEGNLEKAASVLKKYQSLSESEGGEVEIDYNVAMRDLYESAGDMEEAGHYGEIVIELVPRDTRPIEEIMEGR